MRPKPQPARQQPTPQELRDELLAFLERKFYEGRTVIFQKDRRRLLDWVVLWPARWFDERGVTVPAEKYKAIFFQVFLDGLRYGDTGKITYLPAWLAKVIQSHFAHHGDEYYEEAKSMRSLVEHSLLMAGKMAQPAPDPVRRLAEAAALRQPAKKRPQKPAAKDQLILL